MKDEREYAIAPTVAESVAHNTKTLSQVRNLSASLFGVAAGILGLESYSGFLFYFMGSLLVSVLVWVVLAKRRPERYFESIWELVGGELVGGLSSFVLTWTLFFGLIRA
ncbi:MAG: hypothetical protein M1825_001839 [Sarcosagium campestre]|nr:MAG: hypothetical protein M1825_001839 [Sarcosagium campestre]